MAWLPGGTGGPRGEGGAGSCLYSRSVLIALWFLWADTSWQMSSHGCITWNNLHLYSVQLQLSCRAQWIKKIQASWTWRPSPLKLENYAISIATVRSCGSVARQVIKAGIHCALQRRECLSHARSMDSGRPLSWLCLHQQLSADQGWDFWSKGLHVPCFDCDHRQVLEGVKWIPFK